MESLDKLPNALLEMMVVLGLDESSALDCLSPADGGQDLFSARFEPQILAAMSRHVALFPPARPDDSYPPQLHKASSSSQSRSSGGSPRTCYRNQITAPKQNSLSPEKAAPGTGSPKAIVDLNTRGAIFGKCSQRSLEKLKHRPTMRYVLNPVDFMPQNGVNTTLYPAHFPLSNETLASLSTFCFPDGFRVYSEMPAGSVHYLALTNLMGRRTYAVCLTQFVKHSVRKAQNGSWKHMSKSMTDLTSDHTCEAYVPRCYVVISKYSYFTTLKDCLSRLMEELRRDSDDWQKVVKDFVLHLSMTPAPLCGNLQLKFQLFDTFMTLPATACAVREPIDFDLSVVFKCLDVPSVLLIVSSILTRQRTVFTSSSYPLLTLVTQAFLHLIFPFRWQLTYVPVLPLALLELLEAPGTFIMGCHSSHKHFIDQIEDLVVVNLDDGVVQFTSSVEITALPKHPAAVFKDSVRNLMPHLDLWHLETLRTFTYEESRDTELHYWQKSNEALSNIFLTLLAQLFAGVFVHVDSKATFFNRTQFLNEVCETERTFYEKVFVTEMFSAFLKSRLNSSKQDAWTDAVRRVRSNLPSRHSYSLPTLNAEVVTDHTDCLSLRPAKPFVFRLPNFMYSLSHSYTDACVKEISASIIKNADTFSCHQPALLCLRATLLTAQCKPFAALEDLCQMNVINDRLFIAELMDGLLSSMSEAELSELEQTDLYRRSPVLKHARHSLSKNSLTEKSIVMELHKIPERHIDLEVFTSLLRSLLQIPLDADAARRLFNALTLNQSDVVDPGTFQEFYKCWKQNEVHIRQVASLNDFIDTSVDVVIKVSQLINCSVGTGHIVLTHNRLLLLQEGSSHRCREIVRLLDIRSIEQRQELSIALKQRPALRIIFKDGKKCSFSFREDTHCWHLLISEMWSGSVLSEEQNDQLVRERAVHNVLVVDAFLRSGEAEFSSHHKEARQISQSLCYFAAKKAELTSSPQENAGREFLVHYIKVVEPDSSRPQSVQSIDSLLYTDGTAGSGSVDSVKPRLWCGLTNGKLLVYDVETWSQEACNVCAEDSIVCLLETSCGQVWAGSRDSAIYIINNHDVVTTADTLSEHTDALVAMTITTSNRVCTASVDGQLCVWDCASVNVLLLNRVQLDIDDRSLSSIRCHRDQFLCCTRNKLLILSTDGAVLDEISVTVNRRQLQLPLSCFIITSRNELWVGLRDHGQVYVYNVNSFKLRSVVELDCAGVTTLQLVNNQVWIGTEQGVVFAYNAFSYQFINKLAFHTDRVCSACAASDRFVFTAAGKSDGRIAVWQWPRSQQKTAVYAAGTSWFIGRTGLEYVKTDISV